MSTAPVEVVFQATPAAAQGRGLGAAHERLAARQLTPLRIMKGAGDGGQREFWHVWVGAADVPGVLAELHSDPGVAGAYRKPGEVVAAAPVFGKDPRFAGTMYGEAPSGHNFQYGWKAGAKGAGVKVIDVEVAWNLTHEDLVPRPRLLGGVNDADATSAQKQHGTAVLGLLGAQHAPADGVGVGGAGICDAAEIGVIGTKDLGTAEAIHQATLLLGSGDVLLVSVQRPGPAYNFTARPDGRGNIPIEWWADDLEAIRGAVAKGVVVVLPAGNGAESLDDPAYDPPPETLNFPAWWRNPFRRGAADSGAILVGAGCPPYVHGRTHGLDRSRLPYSNFGTAVDAQAWAEEVTSAGYGDVYKDPGAPQNENRWYTNRFSGTCAAAAIVAGCLASLSSVLKADPQRPNLTPALARAMLRATGSPQRFAALSAENRDPRGPGRIGSRVDMRGLLDTRIITDPGLPPTEAPPTDPAEVYYGSMARLGSFILGAEMDSLGELENTLLEPYPIIHTRALLALRDPAQPPTGRTLTTRIEIERVQEYSGELSYRVDPLVVPEGFSNFRFFEPMPTAADAFTLQFDVAATTPYGGHTLRLVGERTLQNGSLELMAETSLYVAVAPPCFVAVGGVRVPVTQNVTPALVTLGDAGRAYDGTQMSSVRGYKRSWAFSLEPTAPAETAAWQRQLFSDVNTPKLLSGSLVEGEVVPVLISPAAPSIFWAEGVMYTTLQGNFEEL